MNVERQLLQVFVSVAEMHGLHLHAASLRRLMAVLDDPQNLPGDVDEVVADAREVCGIIVRLMHRRIENASMKLMNRGSCDAG